MIFKSIHNWCKIFFLIKEKIDCAFEITLRSVSESIVQTLHELHHAWCNDNFLGEPVPVPSHPLGEEPPLSQLQAVSLGLTSMADVEK